MILSLLTHPVLLFFLAAVVCGVVGKFVSLFRGERGEGGRVEKKGRRGGGAWSHEEEEEEEEQSTSSSSSSSSSALQDSIFVVLIVPERQRAERVVQDVLSKATHRQRVRIHAVKAVTRQEEHPRFSDNASRMSVRLQLAKAEGFDPSVARMTTLSEGHEGERYVCTLPHDAHVHHGWDELLVRMHRRLSRRPRSGDRVVLTARPLPSGRPSFMRAVKGSSPIRTAAADYSEAPTRPQPSLYLHAPFLFGLASFLVPSLPDPSCVRADNEDWIVGMRLWTSGASFFCPHKSAFLSASGKDCDGPAGRSVSACRPGGERTLFEYESFCGSKTAEGPKRGTPTQRARLGLSPMADSLETLSKYGTTNKL